MVWFATFKQTTVKIGWRNKIGFSIYFPFSFVTLQLLKIFFMANNSLTHIVFARNRRMHKNILGGRKKRKSADFCIRNNYLKKQHSLGMYEWRMIEALNLVSRRSLINPKNLHSFFFKRIFSCFIGIHCTLNVERKLLNRLMR